MFFTDDKSYTYYVIAIASIVGICLLFLAFYFRILILDRSGIESFTLINWLALTFILAKALPKGIWSISFIFFSAFSIFHCGLIFSTALGALTDQDILYHIQAWYPTYDTEIAIYLVNLAMVFFAVAMIIISRPAPAAEEVASIEYIKRIHHIGGAVLIVMVLLFLALTISTGAISSYGTYLKVMSKSPLLALIFIYLYLFLGMAIVFISVSYRAGFGYRYFIIFAVWGAIAFSIGLRGEVMFPSAVAAAMLGRRRVPVQTYKLAFLVVMMLIATVIVKNSRISGDYSEIDNVNPLNAVAEMGSSLRTVQEVIKWRKAGFELLNGTSYWAPFERQLALFLPIERLPALQDKRLLNVVVQEKAGPIGFSPVAEGYLNFGAKGVLFMALFLGTVFAVLDQIKSSVHHDILIGVAIIPLFIMIRNSFTFVPVQIFIGLVLAILVLHLAKIKVIQN